jgi:predicted nucleotidyltransferase
MAETMEHLLANTVLRHYPATQAVYRFGSYGTQQQWPNSDADIALLLPPDEARRAGSLSMTELQASLERLLDKEVDLINLRQVSTVFQKEIILAERRIFCANRYAADEFEMLVLSLYQKLNEERAELMAEGLSSGRFYDV